MLTYYLTHGLPRVLKVVTGDKGCSEFESEIKITFIKIEIINICFWIILTFILFCEDCKYDKMHKLKITKLIMLLVNII